MKVVYTDEASADLDRILAYTAANYPTVYEPFLRRLRSVILRIRMWPDSAREVDDQPGVRIVPLLRYPTIYFIGTPERQSKSCTSTTPRRMSDNRNIDPEQCLRFLTAAIPVLAAPTR
jgi:toxin ParE1/3/4